ncbi:MAG: hypothetical protein GY842_24435 [bacterium]|nr:hypothetical protein [bacterium]
MPTPAIDDDMRFLRRHELEAALSDYLDCMQRAVAEGADIVATWKAQRQNRSMKRIVEELGRMTGARERCMFCEDSRGTDVEHFWPKKRYPEKSFRWMNLLWACAGCNRCKGDRFPCDSSGKPQLIDPTAEDPWDFLFYDPETDELTARWNQRTGKEDPRGVMTLEIISTLRHQAVAEGRRRTRRNLERAVRSFLSNKQEQIVEELLESIADNDGYGLPSWFFLRDGSDEPPFVEVRRQYPAVWKRIGKHLRGHGPGPAREDTTAPPSRRPG